MFEPALSACPFESLGPHVHLDFEHDSDWPHGCLEEAAVDGNEGKVVVVVVVVEAEAVDVSEEEGWEQE
jgi:hypothetical protein